MIKNISTMGMKNTMFIYGLITLIVMFTIYHVLKRIGVIESKKDTKERDKARGKATDLITEINKLSEDFKSSTIWSPQSINRIPFSKRMPMREAEKLAEKIDDSFGFFNDNEQKIYDVFSGLKNKHNVTSVSYYFQKLYGKSLLSVLISNLNKEEQRNVWRIIIALPS